MPTVTIGLEKTIKSIIKNMFKDLLLIAWICVCEAGC